MRRNWAWLLSVGLTLAAVLTPAEAQGPAGTLRSADDVWTASPGRAAAGTTARRAINGPSSIVRLNKAALDAILGAAPMERTADGEPVAAKSAGAILTLPMPNGAFARFAIVESPILAPELTVAFPTFKTYSGAGLDDPTATVRLDWTDNGFHAQILSANGTVLVDPYAPGDLEYYIAYNKLDRQREGQWVCLFDSGDDPLLLAPLLEGPLLTITNGTTLRTYRLALAATVEYTAAAGGTKPLALARMTTTMNRVNGIYERELAVRMTVATGTGGDPTALIFTAEPDGYTDNSPSALLNENQTKLDTVIGTANYDIGHVFSTGGGGVAQLNSPCNASGKARGVTGSLSPTGDAFDVDYVAHEMGHQFGGPHTFNGTSLNCGGNRSAADAYEPGSGSTIQGYAGICDVEDTQRNSHDYFHVSSLNRMITFVNGAGACSVNSATLNTLPSVTPNANFTVPAQTPFALTAAGSDANGDTLTYIWEQYDLGTASASVAEAATDNGSRPLFRSQLPTALGITRTFPSMPYILGQANNPPQTYAGGSPVPFITCSFGTCLTGEVLPVSTRAAMQFVVTVRDNRAGGGGIATGLTTLVMDGTKGPLQVTSPNTAISHSGGTQHTVTWAVNGTAALAANVKISLSTNGAATFPVVLAASTPNDGSELVTIPGPATTTARIKVEAVGNIFFDISNTNFTIVGGSPPPTISDIPNQTINEDSPVGPIAFTIGGTGTLTVTASSNNTAVVPNTGLVLGGSGTSRNITVSPAADQSGSATVEVAVSDGATTVTDTFVVTVLAVNDAPTIVPLANQTVPQGGVFGPLAVTINDVDSAVGGLTLSAAAVDTTLLPASSFAFGGSGASRTMSITPVPGQNGTTTVTVTVSDGSAMAQTTFTATVVADVPTNFAASVTGSTVTFTWTAPAATATNYVLTARSTPTGAILVALPTGSTATTFSVTAPPGIFYVTVSAIVGGTQRGESNQAGLAVGYGVAPINVAATATTSSFGVTWAHSLLAQHRTGYQLRVGTAPGLADQATLGLPATATSFDTSSVIAGVPFGRYYISIVALPAGPPSTSAEVIATVGTPPVLTFTAGTRTLSWVPTGSPGGYRLQAGFSPGTTVVDIPFSGTSFPIPAGVTGTYYVRVLAVYAFGNTLASNEVTVVLTSPDDPER